MLPYGKAVYPTPSLEKKSEVEGFGSLYLSLTLSCVGSY